jgi:DNA helicase HerA-like ATPase
VIPTGRGWCSSSTRRICCFDEAPKILIDRVEQVVRLIRSKGVGVYFVTQNPLDVPETVLSQLGNRVQHALRAYTPREQKAVKVAAETFRPNPAFDCFEAITQLGVGEALVSTLGAKGVPSMVEWTLIRPPSSRLGPITEPERQKVMAVSPVAGQYDTDLDRDSAFEMLARRAEEAAKAEEEERRREEEQDQERPESRRWTLPGYGDDDDEDERGRSKSSRRKRSSRSRPGYRRQTVTETVIKSVARSAATSLGRALVRGILGSLKKGF